MNLLPGSLRLLLWMHIRGFWRRMVRNARTPKGLVLTLVGVGIFVLWFGPLLLSMTYGKQSLRADPSIIRDWMPLGMLVLCVVTLLTSAGGRPVTFTPAETDFLFCGPYSRRQILMYRLVRSSFGTLIGAAFFSIGFMRQTGSFLGTYLVATLAFLFLLFFSTAAAQVGQILAEKISGLWQRVVIGVVLLVLGGIGFAAAPVGMPTTRPLEGMRLFFSGLTSFRDSVPVRVATSPFEPFARALSAEDWGSRLMWSVVALGVVVVALGVCLRLDGDYLEMSTTSALKKAEQLQKVMRSGVAFEPTKSGLRFPRLPRWGGAGAIIWRQGTTAVRSLRMALVIMLIAFFSVGPLLILKGLKDPTGPLVSLLVMMTFLGGGLFRFDFRADVDRLDTLKMLPISSRVLAAGQLATPVLLLCVFQWILCFVMAVVKPSNAWMAFWIAAFVPVVSLLLLAVENVAFLLVPNRQVTATPGDLTAIARNALVFMAKMLALVVVLGVGATAGFGVGWLTGVKSAGFAVAWVVTAAVCGGVIPVVAWAFERLDLSADAAPNS